MTSEEIKEYGRKWYHANREKEVRRLRKYYEDNRERFLARRRENYADEEKRKRIDEVRKAYIKRYPERERARNILKSHVRRGKITKGVCHCGETKVQAHHPDYSKPLEVIWLCVKHHMELHRKPFHSSG